MTDRRTLSAEIELLAFATELAEAQRWPDLAEAGARLLRRAQRRLDAYERRQRAWRAAA